MTGDHDHDQQTLLEEQALHHLKDKPDHKKYRCTRCDYSTHYSSNLLKHRRRHDDDTTPSSTPSPATQDPAPSADASAEDGFYKDQASEDKKKLKCKDCEYRCQYKSTMIQHRQKHLRKKSLPAVCSRCGARFPTNRDLKRHSLIHEEVKHFGCDQCDFACSIFADLIVHKKVHDDVKESEDDDEDEEMNVYDMLKIEITEEDCEIDPTIIADKKNGDAQEESEDGSVEEEEEVEDNGNGEADYEMISGEDGDGPKGKRFKCKLCGYTCKYPSGMKLHQQRHSGVKLYRCDECSYRCSYSSSLTKHRRTHTGEKPYECDRCDARFARTDHLKNHKSTHANERKVKPVATEDVVRELNNLKDISFTKITGTELEDKRFRCDECDYGCAYLSSLKLHRQRHSGVKLYRCDVCDYRCAYSSSLTKHRRTHTGEKPYECDHCGNRFARGDHLKAHIRSHLRPKSKANRRQRQIRESNEEYSNVLDKLLKNNVNVYRFRCDSCEFRCTYAEELAAHAETHLGEDISYECNRCRFSCSSSSEMSRHRKLAHGDGKCYSCERCDYKTTHSGNFNKHMRVHQKYAQSTDSFEGFKCDSCPFTCLRAEILQKHRAVHVGYEPLLADSEPDFEREPEQEGPLDFSLSS